MGLFSSILNPVLEPLGMGIAESGSYGNPAKQKDPNKQMRDLAIQSGMAGTIAAKNKRRMSSTAGTGADFIANMGGIEDTGPSQFFLDRTTELDTEAKRRRDATKHLDRVGGLSAGQMSNLRLAAING